MALHKNFSSPVSVTDLVQVSKEKDGKSSSLH